MTQVWMIASGKGGVGKSTLAAGLGVGLAQRGRSVALIDGDIGLRSQDTLLGLESRIVYDLVDVAEKGCKLEQALVAHPHYPGLALLPAAQFRRMKSVDAKDIQKLANKLQARFDFVLLDCPAGVERGFLNALGAAQACMLVVTPDDISIRDGERVVSILEKRGLPRPQLIVNRVIPAWVRAGEMYSPETVAAALDLPLLGIIPQDEAVYRCLLRHSDLMAQSSPAQQAMERIVRRMLGTSLPLPTYLPVKPSLWRRVFNREKAGEDSL